MDLESRVTGLERTVRRQRLAGLVVLLVLGVGFLIGQTKSDVIPTATRTRLLEVVNSEGKVVGRISSTKRESGHGEGYGWLELFGREGDIRVLISTGYYGTEIELYNNLHKEVVELGTGKGKGSHGVVRVNSSLGVFRAEISGSEP